ncbi:hypothetical protein JNW88_26210 [Micromonospora sp. ATA32]|nr:hypothetical protein [Micromonospora sp. ATA32]
MTAILLAVLVLLCSGVISFSLKRGVLSGEPGGSAPQTVTSGALGLGERDDLLQTSYRQVERARPGGGETTTSEGRQTR